jgi:hypothetical protein
VSLKNEGMNGSVAIVLSAFHCKFGPSQGTAIDFTVDKFGNCFVTNRNLLLSNLTMREFSNYSFLKEV